MHKRAINWERLTLRHQHWDRVPHMPEWELTKWQMVCKTRETNKYATSSKHRELLRWIWENLQKSAPIQGTGQYKGQNDYQLFTWRTFNTTQHVPNVLAHFRRKENFYLQFSLAIICFPDQSGILYLHNTICTCRYRCPCVNPNTLAWLQNNLITRLKKSNRHQFPWKEKMRKQWSQR